MGALFGLFASLLGIGYAVHQDNKKIQGMQADAVKRSGRGICEPYDDITTTNKFYREVKQYFDSRYNYYINNQDYILNNTNINSYNIKDKKDKEEYMQLYAGFLAYEDLCAKYANGYVKAKRMIRTIGDPYDPECLASVARALARREAYNQGFKPSHMHTMQSPFYTNELYMCDGSWGAAMDYPTEFSYERLANENALKYHAGDYQIYYERTGGK